MSKSFTLPVGRLVYPSIFETAKWEGKDTGKYQTTFIIEKSAAEKSPEWRELVSEIDSLVAAKLKGGLLPPDKLPIKDGDEILKYNSKKIHFKGCYVLNASVRENPPALFAVENGKVKEIDFANYHTTPTRALFYSGVNAGVSVSPWFQDNQYGKRVNLNWISVCHIGHNDLIGNMPVVATASDYAAYGEVAQDEVESYDF